MNNKIGIAKEDINENETCIKIDLATGRVTSDKIKFLPYGKKKVLNKVFLFGSIVTPLLRKTKIQPVSSADLAINPPSC